MWQRNPDCLEIMKQRPTAWVLLCLVAFRARREKKFSSLELGQAYIGDWKNYGVSSEQVYRTDKKWLETNGLITTQVTNKGTIATLTKKDIFNINPNETANRQLTSKKRATNEPLTTNNNVKNKKDTQTSKNSLVACTNNELEHVAKLKKVRLADVKKIHEDILNKISDGIFQQKKYGKTVYWTLLNWVQMAIDKDKIKQTKTLAELASEKGYKSAKELGL